MRTRRAGVATVTRVRAPVLLVALVPVFPLLVVCLWFLLRAERGPWAVLARVSAFVYACFYSALDTINGVAAGLVVQHVPGVLDGGPATLRPVLALGNRLAWIGSSAFLLAAVLTSALRVRRDGRGAVPGAALTALAALSFLDSHIYWPRGVVTMVVLAAGLLLLARGPGPVRAPAEGSTSGRRLREETT